jgi:hypothetical protein
MDILRFLIGKRCLKLSSFGSLTHFTLENCPPEAPQGEAAFCVNCSLSDKQCVYSAPKFYQRMLDEKNYDWPLNIVTQDFSQTGLQQALSQGPYGRCVYQNDNDVCDHQVVSALFEDGITAEFTASAFTDKEERHTEIMGTHGEIFGDTHVIRVTDFRTRESRTIETKSLDVSPLGGHLGGDYGIMNDFVEAITNRDPESILSGPEVSLEAHLMAFAAERSRLNHTVEVICP